MTRAKPDRHSRHIQARLRYDIPAERAAVESYDWFKTNPDYTDRLIIKEGLLALRKKIDKGYKPVLIETEITITTEMRHVLKLIMEHVQMLSTIDLSSARQSPQWDEKRYQDTTTQLNKSVANLFGQSKEYRYTEDDD